MAIDKDLDFTDKTILVTGSGRNLGRAIMLECAARGANVIMNCRTNEAEARGVEQEAQALGTETLQARSPAPRSTSMEARRCSGSVQHDPARRPLTRPGAPESRTPGSAEAA
jgi:NAD(P)-dependent dehydrogenase (short-subunit alcohol dehydrogenase family)